MLFKSIVLALGALASFASASPSAPISDLQINQDHSVAARELAKTIIARGGLVQADVDVLAKLKVEAVVLVEAIIEFAVEIDLDLTIITDIIHKRPCHPSKEIEAIVKLFLVLKLDLRLLIEVDVKVDIILDVKVVINALVELCLSIGIDINALESKKHDVFVAAFIKIIIAIDVKVEVFVAIGIHINLAKRALLDGAAMGSIDAVQSKRDAHFARALAKTGATDIAAHMARRHAANDVDIDIDIDISVAIFVQAIIELFVEIDISLEVIIEIVKSGGHCGCGERPEIVALVALFLSLDLDLKILVDVSLAVGEIKGEVVVKALANLAIALGIDVHTLHHKNLDVRAKAFVTLLAIIDIKLDVFIDICLEIDLRRRAIEFLA